jgi:phosphoglycolate phosphatase
MIEIIRPCAGVRPRAALFDFDGTLSLIRSGWQQIMKQLMLDILLPISRNEAPSAIAESAMQAIDALTGGPTIAQMEWLSAEVARRGGRPDAPETYKQRYLALLDDAVGQRNERIRRGELAPDRLLVPGARGLLEALRSRSLVLILASGTDLDNVLREAAALGIAGYFGPHIYAPGPRAPDFSKRAVIARLLAEEGLSGPELIAFGDGPVEIAETRAAGGFAVGVAFDEVRHAGLDRRKRATLIAAGADLLVPDFEEYPALMDYLFLEQPVAPIAHSIVFQKKNWKG